jgi:hypothetical protein
MQRRISYTIVPFLLSICILFFFIVYGITGHTNPDSLIGKDLKFIYTKGYKQYSRSFRVPNDDEGNYRQVVIIMYKDKAAVYEKITKEESPRARDENADMSATNYFLSPFVYDVPDQYIGMTYDDVVEKLGGPPALKWHPDYMSPRTSYFNNDDYLFVAEYFQRYFEYDFICYGYFGYRISSYIVQLFFNKKLRLGRISTRYSGMP